VIGVSITRICNTNDDAVALEVTVDEIVLVELEVPVGEIVCVFEGVKVLEYEGAIAMYEIVKLDDPEGLFPNTDTKYDLFDPAKPFVDDKMYNVLGLLAGSIVTGEITA
jgi:hypothetical protein